VEETRGRSMASDFNPTRHGRDKAVRGQRVFPPGAQRLLPPGVIQTGSEVAVNGATTWAMSTETRRCRAS
jgi:hypothetical protein